MNEPRSSAALPVARHLDGTAQYSVSDSAAHGMPRALIGGRMSLILIVLILVLLLGGGGGYYYGGPAMGGGIGGVLLLLVVLWLLFGHGAAL